jgi:hypothetical protein
MTKQSPLSQVPPALEQRFKDFCKMHDWTEAEVLTHLMLYALKQDVDLAIPLHSQRTGMYLKKEKWLEEQFQRLDWQ